MTEKLRIIQYLSVNCMPGTVLCDPTFKKTGHTTPGVLCVAGLQRESAVLQSGLGKLGSCSVQFSSVQSLSHVLFFATPWIAACQASLSITNSWSSLKLKSIESVMPSSHLILCSLFLLPLIPPSIRVFSNESTLRMRWPKCWSFSFNWLLEFAQTHIHWVHDAIQSSHSLSPLFSLCHQCFPATRSFTMSQLFSSGGQSLSYQSPTS